MEASTLAKPPPFGDEFFELAMSFAAVSLFAGAFPLAPAVALLSNAIEGRTDAFKTLRCSQRPLPRVSTQVVPRNRRVTAA